MEQTPKEYATELVNKYIEFAAYNVGFREATTSTQQRILNAKQCAKIDVSNTIKALEEDAMLVKQSKRDWWEQVLTELNNL